MKTTITVLHEIGVRGKSNRGKNQPWYKTEKCEMKTVLIKVIALKSLLFVSTLGAYSQESDITPYYSQISKNIALYHFRYGLDPELSVGSKGLLNRDSDLISVFGSLEENQLLFETARSSLTYPKSGMVLFEVRKYGFGIGNDSIRKYYNFYSFIAANKYLVLLDTIQNEILYVGGEFFKSRIAAHFNLDVEKPSSFFYYLKLRTFNWSTSDFQLSRIDDRTIVFTAHSQLLKKRVLINVARADLDNVSVAEENPENSALY